MGLEIALIIVGILIVIVGIFAMGTSIYLSMKYVRFNRKNNSAGLTGEDAARQILDKNGLHHIKVKVTGSILFGNSYSHYFKKVRLRRFTRHKTSITSLAMGAQKSALAVLDKEGDPDMQKRIRLVPLITFGPFAFIPLLIVGVIVDILLFNSSGVLTLVFAGISVLFYLATLILSISTLKTEKKAQERACRLLMENNMATYDEVEDMKELYKLYNIQYINDIILSALELIYRILEIAIEFSKNKD